MVVVAGLGACLHARATTPRRWPCGAQWQALASIAALAMGILLAG